jgi:hypothetical protein
MPSICLYFELIVSFFFLFAELVWSLEFYKNDYEKFNYLKQLYDDEIEFTKKLFFRIWDIEKFFGLKENYFFIDVSSFENDDKILNLQKFYTYIWRKDKNFINNKFLDIKDNLELFINIIDGLHTEDRQKKNELFIKKCDEWNIDASSIYGGEKDDFESACEGVNYSHKKMKELLGNFRKEWELELLKGERNYKWII